ncbi:unnamed protein product [Rotaria sp. Silwood1]|nr:unnamed protein product [Rotaria sp. Silwood1]CAF3715725.1 unnamed protein product [Rotaria sp. Silwood1]CAF3722529.1 unnamed protein product [Rotaria sp. Silwood1]CAF4746754.1 unnamed protein product [Rotaria sp. Silwood1]CAF4982549.1 unnamed protein product [Rotaria sp. Silwood1]
MDENYFRNKIVCVTSAGRGIGKSLALRLAQLGAKVISASKTDEHLKELNNNIVPVYVDLSDWKATKEAINPYLPIQLLVNNAAISIHDSFREVKQEDFDTLFNVNEIARDLIERKLPGSIVNVSSQASAVDGLTCYGFEIRSSSNSG